MDHLEKGETIHFFFSFMVTHLRRDQKFGSVVCLLLLLTSLEEVEQVFFANRPIEKRNKSCRVQEKQDRYLIEVTLSEVMQIFKKQKIHIY